MVAGFGKEQKPEPEGQLQEGTVTPTGTEEKEEVRHDA
jgi:hypothetical protein